MEIQITKRQRAFIEADAAEVLFGGAAGGGKSHGQIVDALIYALRYPHSRQLLLRRTYPELEMSLVRTALALYPRELYSYAASRRMGRFANGSTLDFGYCDSERDVYRYQSAEYDVIRFDELTHFTFGMYRYLLSRLRGTRGYPKQVKSTTNPGGLGHAWVKDRFIDLGPPDTVYRTPGGSRVYLPSRVQDNGFLMRADPDYVTRLQNLSERDRRALLEGDWDIFDGQYFSEFSRAVHIVEPFPIPGHWRRYRTLDYGLDMLACYWIAVCVCVQGAVPERADRLGGGRGDSGPDRRADSCDVRAARPLEPEQGHRTQHRRDLPQKRPAPDARGQRPRAGLVRPEGVAAPPAG